jgi:uracil-DNA glycosylase
VVRDWPDNLIYDLEMGRDVSYGLEYRSTPLPNIWPAYPLALRAFQLRPCDIRVVILGQDPYPQPGKATGLAFSIPSGWPKINSSIKNIIDEVYRDTGQLIDPTLESWHAQGVFLINTRLTVESNKPMSHAGIGWEPLIKDVLIYLDSLDQPIIFLAWGREAQKMLKDIARHPVLKTSHPCKFSAHRGFKGCGHFSAVNKYLLERGSVPIQWGQSPDRVR